MTEHLLLPSQSNEIFKIVASEGHDPSLFEWEIVEKEDNPKMRASRLQFKASPFYFIFILREGQYNCVYSPGESTLSSKAYPGAWQLLTTHFQKWLINLKREINAPDLWSEYSKEANLSNAAISLSTDNAIFSAEEQSRIKESITQLRSFLSANAAYTTEQMALVNSRLNYLIEASSRMGKKDWLTLSIGVLTTIVIGASLAPNQAKEMLSYAGQVLSWLFPGVNVLP